MKHMAALKKQVYALDNGKCHICGKRVKYNEAVLDHVIPKATSGRGDTKTSDEPENLRVAHRACNIRRGAAKIPGQLRLKEDLCLSVQNVNQLS